MKEYRGKKKKRQIHQKQIKNKKYSEILQNAKGQLDLSN